MIIHFRYTENYIYRTIILLLCSVSTSLLILGQVNRSTSDLVSSPFTLYNITRALLLFSAFLSLCLLLTNTRVWLVLRNLTITNFAVFSFWALASVIWSPFPLATLGHSGELLLYVLIIISISAITIFYDPIRKTNFLVRLQQIIIWGLVIRLILLWISALANIQDGFSRINGTFIPQIYGTFGVIHPNTTGLLSLIIFIHFLFKMIERTQRTIAKRYTLLYIVLLLFSLITLLFSQARTSIISIVFLLGVFFFTSSGNHRKSISLLLILIVLIAVFFSSEIIDFLRRGQTEIAFTTMSGRLNHWSEALSWIRTSPIIGYSYYAGTRLTLSTNYGHQMTNLDNSYISTLFELGIVGCFYFLLTMMQTFRGLIHNIRLFKGINIYAELFVIFLIIFLHSFFGPTIETYGFISIVYIPIFLSINKVYNY